MKSAWKATVAAVGLAAIFATTSTANAQYYYNYYHDPYSYGYYDYGYTYPASSYTYSYPAYSYGYYPASTYSYGYGVDPNVLGGALLGLGLGYALFD